MKGDNMKNNDINTNTQNSAGKNNIPEKGKNELSTIDRFCRFAFIMSTIGVLTIGICPAFGAMGIAVGAVFKKKKVELSHLNEDRLKKAAILGFVSFFLFIIDIILLVVYLPYIK